MNILAAIIKNFALIVIVSVLALSGIVLWRLNQTSKALDTANTRIIELRSENKAIRDTVKEVSANAKETSERTVRVEREIRYVEQIPSDSVCGAPVHAAIDLMRSRNEDPK